jgi:hypothetical protein
MTDKTLDATLERMFDTTASLLIGDPSNVEMFNKTRAELVNAATLNNGRDALRVSIENDDMLTTFTILARLIMALNESAAVAIKFAAAVVPTHRLERHMR